jgi:hypothetical protein
MRVRRQMLATGIDPERELTAEQAWEVIDIVWEGDPGGRGWHRRVPTGARWVALDDDAVNPAPAGPNPTFHFDEPPLNDEIWSEPGY